MTGYVQVLVLVLGAVSATAHTAHSVEWDVKLYYTIPYST